MPACTSTEWIREGSPEGQTATAREHAERAALAVAEAQAASAAAAKEAREAKAQAGAASSSAEAAKGFAEEAARSAESSARAGNAALDAMSEDWALRKAQMDEVLAQGAAHAQDAARSADSALASSESGGLWRESRGPLLQLWPGHGSPLYLKVRVAHTVTEAEGGRSPSSPARFSGTERVRLTRCGTNLLPHFQSMSRNGLELAAAPDGTLTLKGTNSSGSTAYFYAPLGDFIAPRTEGLLVTGASGQAESSAGLRFLAQITTDAGTVLYRHAEDGGAVELPAGRLTSVSLTVGAGASVDAVLRPVVCAADVLDEEGVPLAEAAGWARESGAADGFSGGSDLAFQGRTVTVELGQTCFGGTLDVERGVLKVERVRKVFDGTEDFLLSGDGQQRFIWKPEPAMKAGLRIDGDCTHYPLFDAEQGDGQKAVFFGTATFAWVFFNTVDVASVEAFRAFLAAQHAAGTPLEVVYQLAEPYEVELEGLSATDGLAEVTAALPQRDRYSPRRNCVYSDQPEVTAGYARSPIRQADELERALAALTAVPQTGAAL